MRTGLLVALLLGVLIGALANAILAPALGAMSVDLGVTPDRLTLAFSVYAVVYAAVVPLLGRLGDVLGYKPVFAFSAGLFALGSLLAGAAGSLATLVAARAVQAAGAGGLFPVAQAVAGAMLTGHERSKALGMIMAAFALGSVLGPNLGGFLVEHLSWRWVFWVSVPLGVLALALVLPQRLPTPGKREAIDWLGGILVAGTLAALVMGIQGLEQIDQVGFFSGPIAGRFALALLGGGLLYLWERRQREPVLDMELALGRAFLPIWWVSILLGYALMGGLVFAPLYAQVTFLFTAFQSGLILNALALAMVAASGFAGATAQRLGARRLTLWGMALVALGLGAMTFLGSALAGLLAGLGLVGLGIGLAQPPLSHLALGLAPAGKEGQVSGLASLTRSLGVAAGITISGVLLARRSRELAELGGGFGAMDPTASLKDAPVFVQEMLKHTLGRGIQEGWEVAFVAALLGLVAAFLIRPDPR